MRSAFTATQAAEIIGRPISTPRLRAIRRNRDAPFQGQGRRASRESIPSVAERTEPCQRVRDMVRDQGRRWGSVGAVSIAHEIANRKRAEELIRASEERLKNIIQHAAESIYTMSLEGVFTFVSVWTRVARA